MSTSQLLEQLVEEPSLQHRISVSDYHRMIEVGVLGEDDAVELLEGVLVKTGDPHRKNGTKAPHVPRRATGTTRMLAMLAAEPEFLYRIGVGKYHRMIDVGVLSENDPVELIGGVLVRMTPQSAPHARIVWALNEAFSGTLPAHLTRWVEAPLRLGMESEPEPDFAIVKRSDAQSTRRLPRRALLVVEVARSSLVFDRAVKAKLYARARIPEYWIIDADRRRIEVHTRPEARVGKYRTIVSLEDGDSLTPNAFKGPKIAVRALLGRPLSG